MPFSRKSLTKTLLISIIAVTLASCHSREKVLYLQDLVVDTPQPVADLKPIKVEPGDKISIVVSSSNPEVASVFNLNNAGGTTSGTTGSGGGRRGSSAGGPLYTVNDKGEIDFPILGTIHVEGLTRQQIAELIKKKIIEGKYVTDPVVTVEFANLHYTVIGDMSADVYTIDDDNLNIIEAIAMAGDLNLTAERDQIYVIRTENGIRTTTRVDMRTTDIFDSPVYYLKQNDIIYVVPNATKTASSTINETTFRSWGFWVGLFGLATSISAFVISLTN